MTRAVLLFVLALGACAGRPADAILWPDSPSTVHEDGTLQAESECSGSWLHAYNGPYPDMDPYTKWAYAEPDVVGTDPYAVSWSVGPALGSGGWASAFRYTGPKPVPGPSGYLRGSSGLHVLQATFRGQCARITVCVPNQRGTGCER